MTLNQKNIYKQDFNDKLEKLRTIFRKRDRKEIPKKQIRI